MNVSISDVHVGGPTTCGALAAYPLYPKRALFPAAAFDYILSAEAQESGSCAVAELPEPKVGELLVANTGDRPVLFLEGEELVGAKQNRVMCSSVLVGSNSEIVVPVYCTERGRWDSSPACLKTGSHSPPSLRHILKRGDGQAAVWRFIAAKHHATGTVSPRQNMTDALRGRPEVMDNLRNELRYPEGALGIAVVMNGRTVGIDLLDKPETLRKLWDRLVVLGLTLDAMDLRTELSGDSDLPVRLYKARDMRWQRVKSAGLGEAYHARDDDGSLATALIVDGVAIHVSVSMPTIG